jgi:hypothetical protein
MTPPDHSPKGMGAGSLKPDGKPMRALRVLRDTKPARPMSECAVYHRAKHSEMDCGLWHGALATLVARGLAQRGGRPGGYEWWITDAGRELLEVDDA